jgi:hypothetical protein
MTVETIADVPDDMALVTSRLTVRRILGAVDVDPEEYPRGSVFTDTDHGSYSRVYWYRGHVPVLSKPVTRLV